jgi:hypothetical protein
MFKKEWQSQTFKLRKEIVEHLEAATAFFKSQGHDVNKTTLVSKKIVELPTTKKELEAQKSSSQPPSNPLLRIYKQLKTGEALSRFELELIAEEARASMTTKSGELVYAPLLLAMHDAFATALKSCGLRESPSRDGYERYYKGNLVRQQGTVEESIVESRKIFAAPDFQGSPDFPGRNLSFAARNEPFLDLKTVTSDAKIELETILKGAIRNQYLKTQQPFEPETSVEPSAEEYFGKHSQSESVSAGIFRLDVIWDHSTGGCELTLKTGTYQPTIRCGNFVVMMDLMLLIQNVALGGDGGTRGPFVLEKNSNWSSSTGAVFQFKAPGAHIRFSLSDDELNDLISISNGFWGNPGIFHRLENLSWLYGMA